MVAIAVVMVLQLLWRIVSMVSIAMWRIVSIVAEIISVSGIGVGK
jgi:hypothetical protein